METIQMDIMQAQIGSLATDVSRLESKVSNAGDKPLYIALDSMEFAGGVITITITTPWSEILDKFNKTHNLILTGSLDIGGGNTTYVEFPLSAYNVYNDEITSMAFTAGILYILFPMVIIVAIQPDMDEGTQAAAFIIAQSE